MAIDNGLEIDSADTFKGSDEEGVNGDQFACMLGFDMAFAELRAEPFQQADLFVRELDSLFVDSVFQPKKAF